MTEDDPGVATATERLTQHFLGTKPEKAKRPLHVGRSLERRPEGLMEGPPGSIILARDGRNAYRVQPNGEHRKLDPAEALRYHDEFNRIDGGA